MNGVKQGLWSKASSLLDPCQRLNLYLNTLPRPLPASGSRLQIRLWN